MTDLEKIAILKASMWRKELDVTPDAAPVRGAFNPALFVENVGAAVAASAEPITNCRTNIMAADSAIMSRSKVEFVR